MFEGAAQVAGDAPSMQHQLAYSTINEDYIEIQQADGEESQYEDDEELNTVVGPSSLARLNNIMFANAFNRHRDSE
jgi:hypothetical protein